MPGDNCAFPKCGTSRRHKDIGIFKLPSRKGEFYQEWKKEIVNVILKYRVADDNFKKNIQAGNVHICERHFKANDIEITSEY